MNSPGAEPLSTVDRILRWLLFLLVFVPALVFVPGYLEGRLAFTLYREPKHVALAILGWGFLATFAWALFRAHGNFSRRLPWLEEAARLPTLLLAAWLAWASIGRLWVLVKENLLYEQLQYLLLLPLLLVLLAWSRRRPELPDWLELSLVISLGLATCVGLLQLIGPLPGLVPIGTRFGGVSYPSVFGWKNPMALALVGQIFLLANILTSSRRRWPWMILFAAELAYLALLGSRTSYLALAAGSLFAAVLSVARHSHKGKEERRRLAMGMLWILVAASVFVAALAASPWARNRMGSTLEFLTDPDLYWQSDRGLYLRNTLVMVGKHPFGVGLGDWQTHYPVFRKHGRGQFFSDEIQPRRPHSDHTQMLGETGWLGLGLWLAVLAACAWIPTRRFLQSGEMRYLWRAAQWIALVTAMATDYVVEMPFHKLLFFLLVFLAIERSHLPPEPLPGPLSAKPSKGRRFLVALVVSGIALGMTTYYLGLTWKLFTGAQMRAVHARAHGPALGDGQRVFDAEGLKSALELGLRVDLLPGFDKSLHRDYTLMASTALLLGERDLAERWCRRALELHPHYVVALKLMSRIVEDPELSHRWLQSYHYVMGVAEEGYLRRHPLVWPKPPPAVTDGS